MTTDSPGGAEFAAVEMLEALRQRGHDTVMLSDMSSMARDTGVRVAPISIGPKLSTGSWPGLAVRWPLLARRLREALREQAPYDVLMVHYKKEQLLAGSLPAELRRTVVWAEWGPVPFPLRKGLPRRRYLRAAEGASLVMAISPGTLRSVADVGVPERKIVVVPNVMRADEIRFTRAGPCAGALGAGDPGRGLRRRLHLAVSLQEAQRRGGARRARARGRARAPDPRGHRRHRARAARAGGAPGRARPHHPHPRRRRGRGALRLRRLGLLPEPDRGRAARGDPRDARLAALPVDRRRGRRRHDPARVRRHRLARERSGLAAAPDRPLPRRPGAGRPRGRGGARLCRAHVRRAGGRRADRAATRGGDRGRGSPPRG